MPEVTSPLGTPSSSSTAATHAAYTPADFAFVVVKEPEHLQDRAALLMGARGKPGGGSATMKGVTDTPAYASSFSFLAYGRAGVYGGGIDSIKGRGGTPGTRLPHGLYLFSTTDPRGGVRDVGAPGSPGYPGGLGGMTAADKHYVLRMLPAPPQGPQSSLQGESAHVASIILPRPYGSGRASPSQTLTISDWRVDNIMSAMPGSSADPGGAWLEAYVAAWEALATPHPLLGRKPQLSLKFGERWWGVGQTALYLDSVDVTRDHYERGRLASAMLSLRFSEVSR